MLKCAAPVRNAARHIGEVLDVSRATVYNWLTEARKARR
jgi:predicted transcriptional regulator YheO